MAEALENLGPRTDLDVVLCGGTYSEGGVFLPTTFEHSDDFGMLGGEIRNIAAFARASRGLSRHVLFSGGKSKKGAALRGGVDVPAPTAATVYATHFTELFSEERGDGVLFGEMPTLLLDTLSPNTNANMFYSLKLATREGWNDMAVISNAYHMPRVEALFRIIQEKLCMESMHVSFLKAEDIVRNAFMGRFDDQIEAAYESDAGKLRLASEAQGLANIREGRYTFSEVQAVDLESRDL